MASYITASSKSRSRASSLNATWRRGNSTSMWASKLPSPTLDLIAAPTSASKLPCSKSSVSFASKCPPVCLTRPSTKYTWHDISKPCKLVSMVNCFLFRTTTPSRSAKSSPPSRSLISAPRRACFSHAHCPFQSLNTPLCPRSAGFTTLPSTSHAQEVISVGCFVLEEFRDKLRPLSLKKPGSISWGLVELVPKPEGIRVWQSKSSDWKLRVFLQRTPPSSVYSTRSWSPPTKHTTSPQNHCLAERLKIWTLSKI
mmetsp:Transcript_59540/g.151032  ORF Transcript_59540/g.151032 Transcript_59540/m.151032 type:complete len:255 (+) Transcript_59540:276-1040(+)